MEIFFATFILAVIVFILFYFLRSNNIDVSSIPYAKYGSYPIVGHLFSFLHDRTKLLMECYERYGQCFRIRLLNQCFILILSPSDWTTIIRNQAFYFPGSDHVQHLFDVSIDSTGDPEFDAETRRHYVQYLKNREGLRSLVIAFCRRLCDSMKNEKDMFEKNGTLTEWKTCGLLEFSHHMIFQPSTLALFGEIDPASLEKDFRLFDDNFHHFSAALPHWIYSWFFSEELKARSRLNNSWSKHPYPTCESDFIQIRKAHFLANADWISEKDRNGNQTGIFWGSLGNTIPALFWCLFYLLHDPKAVEILKQEIDTYLPNFSLNKNDTDDSLIEEWTPEQLNSCVYLESVVNETLRLAAAPLITRKCSQKTQLILHDGRSLIVEPNETIAWFAGITHYDPNIFPEPNKFIFDRFLNKNAEAISGFIPFGGGKSMCPGRFFAKNEIKIGIAVFLRYIECKLIDTKIIPIQKPQRVGFGVAPPNQDLSIMYRYKI